MLFLGAGASKAAHVADLSDLTERVKAKLIQDNHADLLQHIITILTDADKDHRFFCGTIDLEVILSVLNGIMDPLHSLKDLGPYAIYLNQLKDKNHSYTS